MVVPTKSFTVLPDSDVDPDSPITTTLMTAYRDNDIHLEEWLGANFVAAQDHDHDGVNSALIATLGLQLIERKELSASASVLTFSGLNGDVDEVYVIVGRAIMTAGSVVEIVLRPNGITTGQASSFIQVSAAGAVTGGVTTNLRLTVASPSNHVAFWSTFWARSTVQAVGLQRMLLSKGSDDQVVMQTIAGRWTDTAINITSLDVLRLPGAGGDFGIGSTVALYKLRQT